METKKPKYRSFCIPPEICTQILSYLPVKSLLRFRSVSQEWKSIINNRDFSSLHLSHYTNNRQETIVVEMRSRQDPWALRFSRCPVTKQYRQTSEIDIPVHYESLLPREVPLIKISGNVDGLFLVERRTRKDPSVILWNPSIRKVLHISDPLSPTPLPLQNLLLGFDPSTNDYKVVAINCNNDQSIIALQILALNSHSWRIKRDVYPNVGLGKHNVSLGGSVYWVGSDPSPPHNNALYSFKMTSETISHTPLPEMSYGFNERRYTHAPLVVGSMIGLLAYAGVGPRRSWDGTSDIWVLEEDGCWTKRFKFDFWISFCYDYWVYLNKDGELIWKVNNKYDSGDDSEKVFAFDINIGKKSVVSRSAQPFYVGPFVESLVLLTTD